MKHLLFYMVTLLLSLQAFASFDCYQIKDVSTLLKPEHQHLSPTVGFSYAQSLCLSELYHRKDIGDEQSELKFIIEQLFFIPNDESFLATTSADNKLGKYFDIEDISLLINHLKTNRPLSTERFAAKIAHSKTLQKRYRKFIKSLAYNQPGICVSDVLLTFIIKKSSSREDILRYFEFLESEFLSDHGAVVLSDEEKKQQWLLDRYDQSYYNDRLSLISAKEKTDFNFDTLVFIFTLSNTSYSLPPLLRYDIARDTKTGNEYRDCMEISLLNFLSVFLFDGKKINLNRLDKLAEFDQNIRSFFQAYAQNKIAAKDLHDTWSDAIAKLGLSPDMFANKTSKGCYELEATLPVAEKVLSRIIFSQTERVSSFDEIIATLNTLDDSLSLAYTKKSENIYNRYYFSNGDRDLFSLDFTNIEGPTHAELNFCQESEKTWRKRLFQEYMEKDQEKYVKIIPLLLTRQNYFSLYSLCPENYRNQFFVPFPIFLLPHRPIALLHALVAQPVAVALPLLVAPVLPVVAQAVPVEVDIVPQEAEPLLVATLVVPRCCAVANGNGTQTLVVTENSPDDPDPGSGSSTTTAFEDDDKQEFKPFSGTGRRLNSGESVADSSHIPKSSFKAFSGNGYRLGK
jgi:hypothetical protein